MERYPNSLSPDELHRVLKTAREHSTRDWCMILLSYWHGLRSSEVCGLRLDDIRDNKLQVQRGKGSLRTVQPLHRHQNLLLDEVKAVKAWLHERPHVGSDALFLSRNGGALHYTSFFRIVGAATKAAGISPRKRNPRVLIYSLAAHLAAANVDLPTIAQALGHRSINSTLKYVRSNDQVAAKAVEKAVKKVL
jgi:type 1 fimbriae regulatory protein FimB